MAKFKIAMWGEAFVELFVGYDAHLRETIHHLFDLHVDIYIFDIVLHIVCLYELGGDQKNLIFVYSNLSKVVPRLKN